MEALPWLAWVESLFSSQRVKVSKGQGQFGIKSLSLPHGCQTCHTIPGIRGADGLVGPDLGKLSRRVYVAGVIPNSPANPVRWIQNPRAVDEKTAMPNLNVQAHEARDMAAYLYSLR